ncbi:hypothetical protein CCP3SC1AL1_1170020 [Gammaproteobacteria bacterium]|jgi:hypothetical protein
MSGHFGTKFKYIKDRKDEKILNTDKNRFLSYVSLPNETGCMLWMGVVGNCGYGQFFLLNKKHMRPHRMAYQYFKGRLTKEMFVCHHCDQKLCLSPDHLFLGTPQENMTDMINKKRDIKAKGSKHYLSKLNDNDILNIRKLRGEGKTYLDISKIYNVHMQNIASIIQGRSWSHIKTQGE